MFPVRKKQCSTCIYRKRDSAGRQLGWDIAALEAEIADGYGGFEGFRICHSDGGVREAEQALHDDGLGDSGPCCRGFWVRHKDSFPAGQIAQRLGLVREVD